MNVLKLRKRKAPDTPLEIDRKRRAPLEPISELQLATNFPATPNRHPFLRPPHSPHKHIPSVLCTPASARTLPAWASSSSSQGGDDDDYNADGEGHVRSSPSSGTPSHLQTGHCGMTEPNSPDSDTVSVVHSTPRSPSSQLSFLLRALPAETAEAIAAAVVDRDRQAEEVERDRLSALSRMVGRLEAENEALGARVKDLEEENENLAAKMSGKSDKIANLRGVLRKFVRR